MRAIALNCTLKALDKVSSTERLLRQVLEAMARYEVTAELVRVADLDIKPGVTSDEGRATLGRTRGAEFSPPIF